MMARRSPISRFQRPATRRFACRSTRAIRSFSISTRRTTRPAARSKARIFAICTSSLRARRGRRGHLARLVEVARRLQGEDGFPFPLLSDADEKLCSQFDVIKMKNMYGKKVRGIERWTFLIGADGKLVHEWRKVKVDGHAAEVLAAVKTL